MTVVGASVKNAWKSKDTSPLPILIKAEKSQHQEKDAKTQQVAFDLAQR